MATIENVFKGRSGRLSHDIHSAREQTLRASQAEPDNAMALAVEAIPSEPMARLFKSCCSAMWGSALAVTEPYFARSLSPFDRLQYFFDRSWVSHFSRTVVT